MRSNAQTPDEYLHKLPQNRKAAVGELRRTLRKNLPRGFEEIMNCGMICDVVPHSLYPSGYKADPAQPLPFRPDRTQ